MTPEEWQNHTLAREADVTILRAALKAQGRKPEPQGLLFNAEFLAQIIARKRIDLDRLDRMPMGICEEPALAVRLPDGGMYPIDGLHRWALAYTLYERGLRAEKSVPLIIIDHAEMKTILQRHLIDWFGK
jgi:hypothetical protein